ncbi:efflux RND transporter periplasmic adaptor subunit [Candidatus Nitrospira inopinata]|uniref:efflux RND transporter periplasmic adaptor subunit n=1 Tax=Candidatus Nitrospira inopinata TaxID=1715989 RepID=UPI000784258A|nr:efflux RND transporter periplasmic adaptor subunit [Candidatus Nitrospira inopinata]
MEQPEAKARAEQEKQQAGHQVGEPPQLTVPPEALEGQAFQTTVIERRPFRDEIAATATIKPNEYRLVHLSPRIEGRVIEVKAVLGQQVKSGQVLALLDSIELGQKKSEFLQAKTNHDVDNRNYVREEGLFKEQITSEKEFLDAKGRHEKSLAAYRAAHEALRLIGLSEGDIKHIDWSTKEQPLSYFPLVSSLNGTVIERTITLGELISPKDTAFTIVDLSRVWIILDVYEQNLAAVRVGADVEITVDALPGETFKGTIVYLSDVLNPATRTIDARVEIPNPQRRLRPGMFARAAVILPGRGDDALVAPLDALQQVNDKTMAFVEKNPGTYEVRQVTVGRQSPPYSEIRSGLREGERVVTIGAFYLKSMLLKEQIGGG